MNKKQLSKSIMGGAVILVFAASVFWMAKFFPASQKEIVLNKVEMEDDILADGQIGARAKEKIDELEKISEKTAGETKKESAPDPAPTPSFPSPKNYSNSSLKIVDKLLSDGFQVVSSRKIDTIIIHSSYDAIGSDPYSVSGIISEYKDYGVSAHYLIGRDGTIYRLVKEDNVAYHAGVSKVPDGRTGVNAFSIGIELINTKDGDFTKEQYASLQKMINSLKEKYKIKYILGHDQIAPDRKDDPWNFDWGKIK